MLLAASPELWFGKALFSWIGKRSGLCDGVDLPWFDCEGQVTFDSRVLPRVLRSFEGRELVFEVTVERLDREEFQGLASTAGKIHDFTYLRFTPGGPAVAAGKAVKVEIYKPVGLRRRFGAGNRLSPVRRVIVTPAGARVGPDGGRKRRRWGRGPVRRNPVGEERADAAYDRPMGQVVRWVLLAVLCAATGTAQAQDTTFLTFNSEPGDHVGGGLRFTLTSSDGLIAAYPIDGGVQLYFDGSTFWHLYFVPPKGSTLTPGVYDDVRPWPLQSATAGGLYVFGDGRGCSMITGRFQVLEAEFGPGGEVQQLAVDYEQHCQGAEPALFGSVRYKSGVPVGPRLGVGAITRYEGDDGWWNLGLVVSLSGPADTAVSVGYETLDGTATAGADYAAVSGTATIPAGETDAVVPVPVLGDATVEADETFTLSLSNAVGAPIAFAQGVATLRNDDPYKTVLRLDSEPGDFVGQGQSVTVTPIDGDFNLEKTDDGGVHVRFFGTTSFLWDLNFAPPAGAALAPGGYEGATRWPFQSPTAPGLEVSGGGRACAWLTGRFVVHEAVFGPQGEVLRLAVDFEQHCEGDDAALYGSIRYESNVPIGPRLFVGPVRILEGDGGSASLGYVISLSEPAAAAVTVDYQTVDGSATAGSDYVGVSGTATFPAGETSVPVSVPVIGDLVEEGDETFALSLSNAAGASIAFGEGQGTILNDDPYKTFLRFDSQPGDLLGQGLQFTFTEVDGSITAAPLEGGIEVVFYRGSWWKLRFVPPLGETLAVGAYDGATGWPFQSPTTPGLGVTGEGRGCNVSAGRFTVLEAEYGPAGEVLRFAVDYEHHCNGNPAALFGSVRYDSGVPVGPRLAVGAVDRYEGDDSSTSMGFVISLSAPSGSLVTVPYQTVDGTATAGVDYVPVAGTATFPAGQTTVPVPVQVLGDTAQEPDETFTLSLGDGSGAPVAFAQGLGTILNDDPFKTLLYFNSEPGDDIGGGLRFTMTPADGAFALSRFEGGVYVAFTGPEFWQLLFAPPAGTTLAPGVYPAAVRATTTRPPGSPGLEVMGAGRACQALTGRFAVLEAEYGADGEVLRLAVDYEQHCLGGDPALFGSVRYRSSVPVTRRLIAADASVAEGDSGTRSLGFPVWLSEPGGSPVTVSFATADGTARRGVDYAPRSGSTTLAAGQTDVVIPVTVYGDTLPEADETFSLTFPGVVGAAAVFPPEAVGTILTDDMLPQLNVGDVSVVEEGPGSSPMASFVVSLSAPSDQPVSVAYLTQSGTATAGADYVHTAGTLEVAPGAASGTIAVPIVPDRLAEATETFSLLLLSPANATIGRGQALGTILDDDGDGPLSFYTLLPCRLLDTREAGPALDVGIERVVSAVGACGIPPEARAVVLNVTSVEATGAGDFQAYPAGTAAPDTSVVSFRAGRTRAGIAVVRLGADGGLALTCRMPGSSTGSAHAVVDVSGYFR